MDSELMVLVADNREKYFKIVLDFVDGFSAMHEGVLFLFFLMPKNGISKIDRLKN
jgi:hypothetical protein